MEIKARPMETFTDNSTLAPTHSQSTRMNGAPSALPGPPRRLAGRGPRLTKAPTSRKECEKWGTPIVLIAGDVSHPPVGSFENYSPRAFPEPRGDVQLNPEGNRIKDAVRTVAVAGAQIHKAREIVIEAEVYPVVPRQAHAAFF